MLWNRTFASLMPVADELSLDLVAGADVGSAKRISRFAAQQSAIANPGSTASAERENLLGPTNSAGAKRRPRQCQLAPTASWCLLLPLAP